MDESRLLGTLLPSSPDFQPIIQSMREKYGLPELSPDDDPIEEIFLVGECVALEDFRQDIKSQVEEITDNFLPPELARIVKQARELTRTAPNMISAQGMPEEYVKAINQLFNVARSMGEIAVKLADRYATAITDMLYIYLVTGELQETPKDWFSQVVEIKVMGEPGVLAFASQMADPDEVAEQFRQQYVKTFGIRHPKVMPKMVSTAYYMHLQRAHKPWNFIVEEYIRLNHFKLPRDKASLRYRDTWNRYSKQLRKRIERTDKVLALLVGDKKGADSVA